MKRKTLGVIASGLLVVATAGEICTLGTQIVDLKSEVKEIKQSDNKKTEIINKLNKDLKVKELNIKELEEEIKEKNVDISLLKEDRKIYITEMEKLKQKYHIKEEKYSTKKVSFNENNLNTKSGVDTKRMNKVLEGTGLAGLGNSYVQAEQTYGVNAIFLASLTAQESGWGESNRAENQNNLSGYAVYSDASKGTSFSSKHDSIMATAKLLSKDYLNKDGVHHSGKDIYSVNDVYCPNDNYNWSNSITSIAYKLTNQINSL